MNATAGFWRNEVLRRGVASVLCFSLGFSQIAHAGNCPALADDAEGQLAAAKLREDFLAAENMARRALDAGKGTGCGAQALSIMRSARKEIQKLDEAERQAKESEAKAQADKDKAEADRAKKEKEQERAKTKKAKPGIDMLDFRIGFEGGATPKDQIIAMVDGRVVPLGNSELVSSGAHELVLSPPPTEKDRQFDLEVMVDRKKLDPVSSTNSESVYTFDSKKGASLTLQVKIIQRAPELDPAQVKKPFPWHKVAIYSGAVLLVGGGTLAVWKYLEGKPKGERAQKWTDSFCTEDPLTLRLSCDPPEVQGKIESAWNQQDDSYYVATWGGVIAGVGVGLILLGAFVLAPDDDNSKGAVKSGGGSAVRAAPKPGLSVEPTWQLVPVANPSEAGLWLQGTF